MAAQPSLYEVLRVAPSASAEQIRHAYRAAARRTHPDAGGQPAAFAQVRIAYDILADPDRRRRYDLRLATGPRAPTPGPRSPRPRPGAPGTPAAPGAPGGSPGTAASGTSTPRASGMAAPPAGALLAGADPVVRRRYLILMGIALTLFVTGGAFVRLYSVPAAMAMLAVAAIIPPIAVTVAGRPRHRPDQSAGPRPSQPPPRRRS